MSRSRFRSVLLSWSIAAVSLAVGCAAPPATPIELDTSGVAPVVDYSHLAAVLRQAVDPNGQVLPELLERCSDRLDAQLRILAVTGPAATPALFKTDDDRLAYWYNASAAWSMKLAMLARFPEEMTSRELYHRPLPLDGRRMSLHDIRKVLQQDADFRVALLRPGVSVQSGPLPATPMAGADVRKRIDETFNRYMADEKRMVIDVDAREVRFPPGLWRVRERLIAAYRDRYGAKDVALTTALMPYVHGVAMRRLQDAVGYRELPQQESGLLALPEKFSFLRRALW